MIEVQPMIDGQGNWIDDEDEELETISCILKDAFGEDFENASIRQKLFFLENTCRCMRLDTEWDTDAIADTQVSELVFPSHFQDTHEAVRLIEELTSSIILDRTFHDLVIEETE